MGLLDSVLGSVMAGQPPGASSGGGQGGLKGLIAKFQLEGLGGWSVYGWATAKTSPYRGGSSPMCCAPTPCQGWLNSLA